MGESAPSGFRSFTTDVGFKTSREDFSVVVSDRPCACSAMFTQSLFPGHSVTISRRVVAEHAPCGVVTIAQNANVATGPAGRANADEILSTVGARIGLDPDDLLISSTGAIGIPYPMDVVREKLATIPSTFGPLDIESVARAMMTTDTAPKFVRLNVAGGSIHAVAKGVGMIEPDMATMLSYFFTDLEVDGPTLDRVFRRAVDLTFNSLTIDGDTSTSDTVAVFANGRSGGGASEDVLLGALVEVATELVRTIASDGEGATKRIEVEVAGATSEAQARTVAKSILNSPLVKAGLHGSEVNWGRMLMAIGKLPPTIGIVADLVRVRYWEHEVYPRELTAETRAVLEARLASADVVELGVDLGVGAERVTAYGCDLSPEYVVINAGYLS